MIASLLLAALPYLNAQQDLQDKNLQNYIEQLADMGYDDFVPADLVEEIESLRARPVDINSDSREDLARLFFLTPFQQNSILEYRLRSGTIISFAELQYLPGFDRQLAELVEAWAVILPPDTPGPGRRVRATFHSAISGAVPDSSAYPGQPYKLSVRSSISTGRVESAAIFEKDRGERFVTAGAPEYLAGYVSVKGERFLSSVTLGDYRVRFGQGLVVWQGYSPGITPLSASFSKGVSRVTGHASADENNYFRGVSVTARTGDIKIISYLSSNRIDATPAGDTIHGDYIASLYDSGLHTTDTEISKRNLLTENSAGINISRTWHSITLGASVAGTHFSIPFSRAGNTENLYDFSGRSNLAVSVDHAISYRNIYLYGETAIDSRGRPALLQGVRLTPDPRVIINLLFAHTGRGYTSFHGQVFGKETLNNFGRRALAGIRMEVAPRTFLHAGITARQDYWYGNNSANFPGSLKYQVALMTEPTEMISLNLDFQYKSTLADQVAEQGVEGWEVNRTRQARLHLELQPFVGVRFVSRVAGSLDPDTGETGWMAYQGVRLDGQKVPLTFIARFYTYNIPSWSTRIYAWEDDLRYSFSIPALYGSGKRSYIVLVWRGDPLTVRFKQSVSGFSREGINYNSWNYGLEISLRFGWRRV